MNSACNRRVCLGILTVLMTLSLSAVGLESIGGSLETAIDVNPSVALFAPGLTMELTLAGTVGTAELTSISTINETGWLDQVFRWKAVAGGFTFSGMADFDPQASSLDSANCLVNFYMFGVAFDAGLYMEPGASGLTGGLTGQDALGTTFKAALLLNVDQYGQIVQTGCHSTFTSGSLLVSNFPVPCCPDVTLNAKLSMTDAGFDSFEVSTSFGEILGIPWLTLRTELTFTLDEKILDMLLYPAPTDWNCFTLIARLDYGQNTHSIDSLGLMFLVLECELGGIHFRGETWFTQGTLAATGAHFRKWSTNLSGSYYEAYWIWTSDDGCCGPLDFELVALFAEDSLGLFDLSALRAQFLLQLTPMLQFGTGMEFDFDQPLGDQWVYWDIYFDVTF